jgi:serine/threonine protein kinase
MIGTADVDEIAAKQILGKCLLLECIGEGSSGQVFLARHSTLDIPVAVKVLRGPIDDRIRRRVKQEARLLARINHPNIVRIWDFCEEPDRSYLVLEYVAGMNLAEVLEHDGRMPPSAALEVVAQITEGLSAAQDLGIVHRDIKPGNILLAHDGTAKLADLGLAVLLEPGSPKRSHSGSIAYRAPEQARGKVDQRSDIYALGATFYHLVTGRAPFQGTNKTEVVIQHAQAEAVPPHELAPCSNPALSEVILKMLAKQPQYRYQTYNELKDALFDLEAMLAGSQ